MKKQTIGKFFKDAGFDYKQMEINKFYPVEENWEILTRDSSGENAWRRVTHLVRKETTVPILVSYLDEEISVSPEHKFFTRISGVESWVEAIDLLEEDDVFFLHESGEWVSAVLKAGNEEIDILDMSVEDVESYYSGGLLSHNTMYGDPTTTPGGMAIPFHSSVRIKLGAGSQILNKDKEVIGINVSAKTVKNKVAAPFRKCLFEIHFGVGIKEHEQLFDLLRKHGEERIGDDLVCVGGNGSWKEFSVTDANTGEVKLTKKFYKADFGDVMNDPQYSSYIDDLLERAMTRKVNTEEPDIDMESYEEVRALASDMTVLEELSPES